jgi:hypothetical protein
MAGNSTKRQFGFQQRTTLLQNDSSSREDLSQLFYGVPRFSGLDKCGNFYLVPGYLGFASMVLQQASACTQPVHVQALLTANVHKSGVASTHILI